MYRRLTRSFVILTLLIICSAGHARAIECLPERGKGSPWSWRLIDGKQCWYKGKRGMDKKLLNWPKTVGAAPASAETASDDGDAERERLLYSYWPPLR